MVFQKKKKRPKLASERCQASVGEHHYLFDCRIFLALCAWCM